MFNQANLEILPSIRVASVLSLPFIAALTLILLANIPIVVTVLLCILLLGLFYHFISNYILLTRSNAINRIELFGDTVYLEDKQGQRYNANLLPNCFIHRKCCLLSFQCEPLAAKKNLHIPPAPLSNYRRFNRLSTFFQFIRNRVPTSPRRHLFICRYNIRNVNEYRRLRVWFKFQ